MTQRAREAALDWLGSAILTVAAVLGCLLVGRFLGVVGLRLLHELRRSGR